ncbi:helix-turn-helix domain-containing protein [Pantoea vagans]|uniref:helix-turn-helix domain-containing protein n=1 Tax=Pantoea vagans TaxID=470934 RepID=UPI00224C9AFA|nr:helix-turn-helix domain-containing protein [Pantoea vagans]MCX3308762.1 helix-turn-helix domain-containing protein [Pantoea vagans]
MKLTQIRNATLLLEYAGNKFLIDPMLADKDAWPGFAGNARPHLRNPMAELPLPVEALLAVDAVIVTHTHMDHWDEAAQQLIPKTMMIYSQNEGDAALIRSQGFALVRVLQDENPFVDGLTIHKTEGQHGSNALYADKGTYVLAYAGLLDQHRAATHWEFERDFSERFPQVHLDSNALYTRDDRLITSAGTAAGIDCCLDIIRQHYGSAVANRVARRMVVPPYREGGQAQFIERPVPETTRDGRINALLASLRENIHQPQDLDTLSQSLGMSRRTLTRHFHKATGMSLGEWLTAERLQHSQQLLETTGISIESVAARAGFDSPVSFRQRFKSRFGVTPSEWRRTFRGQQPEINNARVAEDNV